MIKLGQAKDGRLVLASNQPFPSDIQHIEYYKDQRLFLAVYENEKDGDKLLPCEISEDVAKIVEKSPEIMIVAMAYADKPPEGYDVPLIQIGV